MGLAVGFYMQFHHVKGPSRRGNCLGEEPKIQILPLALLAHDMTLNKLKFYTDYKMGIKNGFSSHCRSEDPVHVKWLYRVQRAMHIQSTIFLRTNLAVRSGAGYPMGGGKPEPRLD